MMAATSCPGLTAAGKVALSPAAPVLALVDSFETNGYFMVARPTSACGRQREFLA